MKQLAILLITAASVALGEAPGTIEVKGSIGYTGFADDRILSHLQTGGSAKFYITKRFSLEPEFQYLKGSGGHYDLVLLPNANWDLRDGGRVVPYLTGGVGWTQGLDRFSGTAYRYNQTLPSRRGLEGTPQRSVAHLAGNSGRQRTSHPSKRSIRLHLPPLIPVHNVRANR